jgi:hypothetical protein
MTHGEKYAGENNYSIFIPIAAIWLWDLRNNNLCGNRPNHSKYFRKGGEGLNYYNLCGFSQDFETISHFCGTVFFF